MDQTRNEKTAKRTNQAWRKRPRQFAPKSRLGCKTCKIRRVKCDLARPSCLKCKSTGRTCDGYSEWPVSSATETVLAQYHLNNEAKKPESHEVHETHDVLESCTTMSAYPQKQWQQQTDSYPRLSIKNPGAFMILPITGPASTEAMSFFEYISINDLNKYQPSDESWRKTLMYFSQTVPSVRHAATALALLHRNYMSGNCDPIARVPGDQPEFSRDKQLLEKETPLFHYTMAIQHLLKQDLTGRDSTERTAITLLVCYLFTCFDHLAINDVQALKHLRGGVELSRNLVLNIDLGDDISSSDVRNLVVQVTNQIRRLDRQVVMFALDWTPMDIQEADMYQTMPSGSAFRSLEQASDHIQTLMTRIMKLGTTDERLHPTGKIPPQPLPSSSKYILLNQLETWSNLFEVMLLHQRGINIAHETDFESSTLITLLRLQHKIAWIFLSSHGPGREMEYDAFLPQFQECVTLASDVAAAHERYSGSLKPTFTPEIGILPVLYIIGAKCRHPLVRRDVLDILRRQPMREAIWNSTWTARVLERIIELEEGGSGEGLAAQSMGEIDVWQRVEAFAWVFIDNGWSTPRLDVRYTFCMREGVHTESLDV